MRTVRFTKGDGFSLVEINMAILVIGLGMLVLFGLFPVGLREGENALVTTHTALFADAVFNGLRHEAATGSWSEWKQWRGQNVRAMINQDGNIQVAGQWAESPSVEVKGPLVFPPVSNPDDAQEIYYIMEVAPAAPFDMQRRVWLWAQSGKHVTKDVERFKAQADWYYAAFFYGSGQNQ